MADRSVFGGGQEKMVLKQLQIMNDAEFDDHDDYDNLVKENEILDADHGDQYEKAPAGGAVKTFTIDTIFTQIGGFGRF